jgi:hypothetical protein
MVKKETLLTMLPAIGAGVEARASPVSSHVQRSAWGVFKYFLPLLLPLSATHEYALRKLQLSLSHYQITDRNGNKARFLSLLLTFCVG